MKILGALCYDFAVGLRIAKCKYIEIDDCSYL